MITLFDTSLGSENLGDQIIMEAVEDNLREIFPDEMFVNVSTHDRIGSQTHKLHSKSKLSIVGGTNIITNRMRPFRQNQWNLKLIDSFFLKNIILLGVGCANYEKVSIKSFLSKFYYKIILNKNGFHSVRDSHTLNTLRNYGFENVINTGCPTIWKLDQSHCSKIPTKKSKNVVFTLTDYNRDYVKDQILVDTLLSNYDEVYFWAQGSNDLEYVNKLKNFETIRIISPDLNKYNEILKTDIDYVGTRLHAGIRAIQLGKRSIIIGIDNRAIEKHKDFNITVINRDNISSLGDLINSDIITDIWVPTSNIEEWKNKLKQNYSNF